MDYNIDSMPRKKGRPPTQLKKLLDTKNELSNQDIKLKVESLIGSIAKGNTYDNIKRGIDFLKSNEQNYEQSDLS